MVCGPHRRCNPRLGKLGGDYFIAPWERKRAWKNSAEKGGSEEGGLEEAGGCCRKIAAFYSGAIENIQAPAWSRCAAEAYVFTCKGRTVNGKMQPPAELLPRFLSRCLV